MNEIREELLRKYQQLHERAEAFAREGAYERARAARLEALGCLRLFVELRRRAAAPEGADDFVSP